MSPTPIFRRALESGWVIRFSLSTPLGRLLASLVVLGLMVSLGRAGLTPYLTARAAREVASGVLLIEHPKNPYPDALLAGFWPRLGSAQSNLQLTRAHYRAALRRRPLNARLWLGLARLSEGAGNREAARRALEMALQVAGPSPRIRWEAVSLHLAWGELEQALAHLRFIYEVDPARRSDVLILGRLLLPPQEIVNRLIPNAAEALRAYFAVLLAQRNLTEARMVWDRLEANDKADFDLSRYYAQVLIQEGAVDEAVVIWRRLFGNVQQLVSNGGFEREIVGWGFGWQFRERSAAAVNVDRAVAYAGHRSLRVRLAGMPASYDLVPAEQLIPVTPGGTYQLAAKGKASELFTRSGILFEVLDGGTGQSLARTRGLRGTRDWTSLEADFRVPPDVRAVRLRLRRQPSDVWELPIHGTAWVDEVTLRPASMSDE